MGNKLWSRHILAALGIKLGAALLVALLLFPASLFAIDASNRYRSPRNPERKVRRSTDLIILHTTEAPSRSSLNKLSDRGEAHYCVTEEGTIYRIVDRDKEAFHAGRSMWRGKEDVDKFSIDENSVWHVKGIDYSLEALLGDRELAAQYEGGVGVVLRLSPDDFHRYCYLDDGRMGERVFIPGKLHTVQPIADREQVLAVNCREYTILGTEHMGPVIQMEVGAVLVGKIVNYHENHRYLRGEEKAAAEIVRIHDVDDHIGIFIFYISAGNTFFTCKR